jgi:tripartite-type tricarboxylate transporter receptor subunit TctC
MTAETAMKAQPDGYTLLLDGNSLWFTSLMQKTPYDMQRDFAPITLVLASPTILVVHPSLAANSVKELIALAKAKPGELNYASTGAGAATHLAAELFNTMAGVNIVRITYKGTPTAIVDLIGGQVQLLFINVVTVTPHVKSGKLKALAITSDQPSALFPGLPTVAASGLAGYESSTRQGIFAPARTPQPIIERLNREIVRVLNSTDTKERASRDGGETVGSSPQALAAAVKSEMVKWAKVIKDGGIRAE